jgi:hypothetical protein
MLMASGGFTTSLIEDLTKDDFLRSFLIYGYLFFAGLLPLAYVGTIKGVSE